MASAQAIRKGTFKDEENEILKKEKVQQIDCWVPSRLLGEKEVEELRDQLFNEINRREKETTPTKKAQRQ